MKKYASLLNQAANDYQLDPALRKAVIAAESGFNSSAVSPKGAIGLMQIMPTTAEHFGLQSDLRRSVAQKLADPKTNIRLGACYLRFLQDLCPNQPHLMLASYNAGEGAVQKYNNAIPLYPETRSYVKLVSKSYRLYQPVTAMLGMQQGITVSRAEDGSRNRIHMSIPGRSASGTSFIENTSRQ